MKLQEVTDDEIKATLKISDIQANHFTQYTLTATNDIGPKTITVALTQGSPPKKHNKHPQDQASNNNPGESIEPNKNGLFSLLYRLKVIAVLAIFV